LERVFLWLSGLAATIARRPSGDRAALMIDQSRWVMRVSVAAPRS
jgi:hypothetical protein